MKVKKIEKKTDTRVETSHILLQLDDFLGYTAPSKNCNVKVGCNGLQWKDFWGISPLTKIAM